jgi:hypothetical protein
MFIMMVVVVIVVVVAILIVAETSVISIKTMRSALQPEINFSMVLAGGG